MSRRFDEPRPFVIGGPLTPAVRALLIANGVVWVFSLLAQYLAHVRLDRLFGLVPYDVTHHLFLWQLVTYMFLHGGLFHIGFNMLTLWIFGSDLESVWGTRRFTRFYFITGIGAAICTTLAAWNSFVPTIGASGAIYGIILAYGLTFPDRIILFMFVLPIKAKYFALIMGLLAFWNSVTETGGGIAHVAHLGGMIFGWLYLRGMFERKGFSMPSLRGWRERRRQERLKKQFKVYYRKTRGDDDPE